MPKELVFLPGSLSFLGILVLMIAAIVEYRQGHISRPAIMGNAFLLWQIFYGEWNRLPELLQLYLNIGTCVAVIAFISYLTKESLPAGFYQFCYFVYGSFTILALVWWWSGMNDLVAVTLLSPIMLVATVWIALKVLFGGTSVSRRRYRRY